MSYRLHPTKNKKLRPGEPKHYQFEYYSPDPDHPGKRIRHTVVQQFENDKRGQLDDGCRRWPCWLSLICI